MVKKILVIDDQQYNHILLSHIFNEQGFNYIKAANGKDGLSLACSENPDIILLDIMMPDMDGIEVLKRLKNNPDTSRIPVIMLSGKSNEEDINKALNIGAEKFIIKPFKPKELSVEIESVITGTVLTNNKNENEVLEILKTVRQNNVPLGSSAVKKIIFNFVNSKQVLTEIVAVIGTQKITDLKSIVINLIKNSPFLPVREKSVWALGQIGNSSSNNPDNAIYNNEDIDFLYVLASSEKEKTETRLIACMSIKQLGYAMLVEDLIVELNNKFSENF